MSAWQIGRKFSDETKAKISAANKGNRHTDEAKAKMRAATNAMPIITCPHCAKQGRGRAMKQWHFDNCKFKVEVA